MNELQSLFNQLKMYVDQSAPQVFSQPVPFSVVCLVAGVGLSVLGAKLARFGFTSAFAVLGGFVGEYFSRQTEYPTLVCMLVGALMIGLIAYHTFRLWVGVTAALVLSSVALSVFGYQRIIPHVAEFERTTMHVPAEEPFVVPSQEQQEAIRDRSFQEWVQQVWDYATQRDAKLESNGKAISIAAMVTGLCLGVLAMRWALIFSAAVIGTMLVTTGLVSFMARTVPGSYSKLQTHPDLVGMVIGAFFVTSVILQMLLTRSRRCCKQENASKT